MRYTRAIHFIFSLSVLILCTLIFLAPEGIASAHVFLQSAQPPPDQVQAHAPSQVVLTFSGPLRIAGSQMTVTDASGQHFETGPITVDHTTFTTMTVALKPLPDGVYTVTYTVISDLDGHETDDNYQFGVGSVTLTPNAPNRACAMLPTIPPPTVNPAPSVRIVSPADNSTLNTSHLDYIVNTSNFNLGSNGNYADVYVDGQKVQKIESIGTHSLDLTSGIHDLCISLVDGPSGVEVGARTGIRFLMELNGTSSNGITIPTITIPLALIVVVLAVVVLAGVIYLVYRRRRS